MRGGFGMFYDRPFDNLWQNVRNNGILLPFVPFVSGSNDELSAADLFRRCHSIREAVANSDFPG